MTDNAADVTPYEEKVDIDNEEREKKLNRGDKKGCWGCGCLAWVAIITIFIISSKEKPRHSKEDKKRIEESFRKKIDSSKEGYSVGVEYLKSLYAVGEYENSIVSDEFPEDILVETLSEDGGLDQDGNVETVRIQVYGDFMHYSGKGFDYKMHNILDVLGAALYYPSKKLYSRGKKIQAVEFSVRVPSSDGYGNPNPENLENGIWLFSIIFSVDDLIRINKDYMAKKADNVFAMKFAKIAPHIQYMDKVADGFASWCDKSPYAFIMAEEFCARYKHEGE